MFVLTALLSVLLAAVLATSAVRKARGARDSLELRDRLGLTPGLWSTIALLEGLAAVGFAAGLALVPLGVAAAAGVVLLMAGAVGAHLRRGMPGAALVPPAVLSAMAP